MLAEALEHLVRGIVDHPDDVTVRDKQLRRGSILEVRVHPDDLGKVIGRNGRTATAFRTVVSALAGIYFTLRFGSARGDNATGYELQVIAAVLLGGVSIFGGRGAIHGVIAGVLLIGVLASALRLANVTCDVINIITGVLLVLSVVTSSFLAWLRKRRRAPGGTPRVEASTAG